MRLQTRRPLRETKENVTNFVTEQNRRLLACHDPLNSGVAFFSPSPERQKCVDVFFLLRFKMYTHFIKCVANA